MAKVRFGSVGEYVAAQPEAARDVLERVRGAIRKALPEAEESVSYNIPTYKIDGSAVLYFAGWKAHYSIYPCSEALVAKFRDELAPYAVHKATVRFPFSDPVPEKLITRIARFRAEEIAKRAKPPGPSTKPPSDGHRGHRSSTRT